ncbi:MAG TPA: response regulator [Anaeromyxobacteraceae bacterium]|nr:response regulator [Anaeromyxobacteraceae bacterium]
MMEIAAQAAPERLKILIIEDDPELRSALRDHLASAGHEVAEADGVQSGIAAFRENVPDVALLDHGLGDGDAFDLLRILPEVDRRVPLVVLTGLGNVDVAVRAMKEGAHDFLTKPVKLPELVQKLHQATAERRRILTEAATAPGSSAAELDGLTLRELERRAIERALQNENSRVVAAAKRLGIPRSTLYQKLKEFGIPVPRARRRGSEAG